MIGSRIDHHIRDKSNFHTLKKQFGSFIIRGEFTIIAHFFTNNTNGIHVRRIITKREKKMICKHILYDPISTDCSYSIVYNEDDSVEYSKMVKSEDSYQTTNTKCAEDDIDRVIALIYNVYQLNPVKVREYKFVMREILSNPIELDSLSNKIILSAAFILSQAAQVMAEETNKKFRDIMNKGTMFFVLSRKGYNATTTINFNNSMITKSLYTTMSGSKQDNVFDQLKLIKRGISDSVKKTSALFYPSDAEHFICPLTSKELEGAGEIMEFAQFTTVTVPMDLRTIITECEKFSFPGGINYKDDDNDQDHEKYDNEKESYYLVYGDIIPQRRIYKKKLLELKARLPNIVLFKQGRILRISYTGNIPIKYSPKYKVFVSPHEKVHIWPDAFDLYAPCCKYGYTIQYLNEDYNRIPPAKSTVFQLNKKGSMCTFDDIDAENNIQLAVFKNTGGTHSSLITSPTLDRDMMNCGRIKKFDVDRGEVTQLFDECRAFCESRGLSFMQKPYKDTINSTNDYLVESDIKPNEVIVNYQKLLNAKIPKYFIVANGGGGQQQQRSLRDKRIKKMTLKDFQDKYLLCGNYNNRFNFKRHSKTSKDSTTQSTENVYVYIVKNDETPFYQTLIGMFRDPVKNYQLKTYCAFGDIGGGTVEDGVVADIDFINAAPKQFLSCTTRVNLKKSNGSCLNIGERNKLRYMKIESEIGNEIVYGILYSTFRLQIKCNDNVKIKNTCIRDLYVYTLYIENFLPLYTFDSSFYEDHIIINYTMLSPLGIGTKLANTFGQKDVICKIEDLRHFGGYNARGEFIKPSLLFPIQSLIGRNVGRQYVGAMESQDLVLKHKTTYKINNLKVKSNGPAAFGLVRLFVHHQNAPSKVQSRRPMKNDLWTNQNGFDGNYLSSVPVAIEHHVAKNQCGSNRNTRAILELLSTNGIKVSITT